MWGIALCAVALALAIVALVLFLLTGQGWRRWEVLLSAAVILMALALLWGNVGVIYSNAGFTG